MHMLRNVKWLPVLMVLTIMAIAAFQFYWLNKAYEREERTLDMRANFTFRETVFELQGTKLKLDKILGDSSGATRLYIEQDLPRRKFRFRERGQKVINMVDIVTKKIKDSAGKAFIIRGTDTMRFTNTQNLLFEEDRPFEPVPCSTLQFPQLPTRDVSGSF